MKPYNVTSLLLGIPECVYFDVYRKDKSKFASNMIIDSDGNICFEDGQIVPKETAVWIISQKDCTVVVRGKFTEEEVKFLKHLSTYGDAMFVTNDRMGPRWWNLEPTWCTATNQYTIDRGIAVRYGYLPYGVLPSLVRGRCIDIANFLSMEEPI